jgi:hypothetical protein
VPPLQQFFYVSRSLAAPQQVEELLELSRGLNTRNDISGALLFTGGYFAQVLEGPQDKVHATMARITLDGRHAAVRPLLDEPTSQRRFGDWTMASTDVPGADDLLGHLLTAPEVEPARIQRLITLMFANVLPQA